MYTRSYARSPMTDDQLRERLLPRLAGGQEAKQKFLERCSYIQVRG